MSETLPALPSKLPQTLAELRAHVLERLRRAAQALGAGDAVADDASLPMTGCRDPGHGDLSLPCFALRGVLEGLDEKRRGNPAAIAQAMAAEVATDEVIERVAAAGPYLNVMFRTGTLIQAILGEQHDQGAAFGGGCLEAEKVLVEFSAPNTNKPQHLGHVRNNLLGESVSRMLAFAGRDVVQVNLINDRGIHICKSMLAYQRWGHGVTPETAGSNAAVVEVMRARGIWSDETFAEGVARKGDHLIGDFYVLFNAEFQAEYAAWRASEAGQACLRAWLDSAEGRKAQAAVARWNAAKNAPEPPVEEGKGKKRRKQKAPRQPPAPEAVYASGYRDEYFNNDSELGAAAHALLIAWEEGDEGVRELWAQLNRWVISGFEETYRELGVSFDQIYYESETYKLGKEIIDAGLEGGVFRVRDDGATVFDLSTIGKTGEKVVLRSDGTSVYMTQDLGTAISRHDEHQFERMIYVVGSEQDYHFEVLFGILGQVREALAGRCHHLSYGMVHLPSGRMKSREGTVVDADELILEMQRLSRAEIESKRDSKHYLGVDEAAKMHRARVIGLAALKFYLLDVTPKSDMTFDPEKSLDFTGRTGVYCLYNYARSCSLIRKAGGVPEFSREALAPLGTSEERRIVAQLAEWPRAVEWAAAGHDTAKITEFLYNLCRGFAFLFTDKVNHPIATCPDPALRGARLLLVQALQQVLAQGLTLLGIETLEEM